MDKCLACWALLWVATGVSEVQRSWVQTTFKLIKYFTQKWHLPCCQCMLTCSHVSSIYNAIYTLMCKQLSGLELWLMCDTVQLVLIYFWWMGHGRGISMLDTTVDGEILSLRFRGHELKPISSSNLLMTGIYLVARAQWHVLKSPPFQDTWLVLTVSLLWYR